LRDSATASAGIAIPYLLGSARTAFSQDAKAQEKNDRPLVGAIGCGGQGSGIANRARQFGDVVAVCDVDQNRAEAARQRLAGGNADVFKDYRHLLDRKDIDVVTIGTPDHWHTRIAIHALQAGKDVYCEKPLTLTIDEGKLICQVVKATKRVFQVGTQQRSEGPFAKALAIVRDGRIGKVQRVTVAIGGAPRGGPFPKTDPPPNLDWDMWLGQAPKVDYIAKRCHYEFRWWYEYSGGKMTDWGAHHVDIAHWVIGAADTGPTEIAGEAEHPVELKDGYPVADDQYNTALTFNVRCKFADGVELFIRHKAEEFDNGVMIEGDQGRIFVNRGKLTGKAVDELAEKPLADDAITKVCKGQEHGNHMRNFFACIKTREQPISDVFSHHRALTTCHLANIAIRLGRTLQWDPQKEQIIGDAVANGWQQREQRQGYEITV
jgi:predicted dehydrogenase